MRKLSKERRRLIDGLVERAFDTTAQTDPSAALREEVTATLEAALADPDVAGQLEAGTLLRAVRWSGFGAGGPALTAVSGRSTSPRAAAGKSPDRKRPSAEKQSEAAARRAADREGEQNRQRQLAEARDRLAVAKRDCPTAFDRLRRKSRRGSAGGGDPTREAEGALRAAQRDWQALIKRWLLLGDSTDR
jgi:hypothetical protein